MYDPRLETHLTKGIQEPYVVYCIECSSVVLPGFCSTTTVVAWKRREKCSVARLALAIATNAFCNGCPHACRKPVGSRSLPGALHGPVRQRASPMSSSLTLRGSSNQGW